MQITKRVEKKNPLTLEELRALMDRIIEAQNVIDNSEANLDAMKETNKELKKEQGEIISKCYADYKRGYTTSVVECFVTYNGKEATYIDSVTSEVITGKVLEDGEQLDMTNKGRIDAEQIIRESTKNED